MVRIQSLICIIESTTVGFNDLALAIITVFVVVSLLGTIRGSRLTFGIRASYVAVAGTANGAIYGGKYLWSLKNVTECGSSTGVGLYQFMVCPALISILWV
jgi:hypothetical protein